MAYAENVKKYSVFTKIRYKRYKDIKDIRYKNPILCGKIWDRYAQFG